MVTWTFGLCVERGPAGVGLPLPSPGWTLLRAALTHPGMIPDLLSAGWAFRRRDWMRRAPFLPVPSQAYLRWRMETAYGDPEAVPPVEDLRRFLRWARQTRAEIRLRNEEARWADFSF